jgi:arsenate reductase (thioredoxin)
MTAEAVCVGVHAGVLFLLAVAGAVASGEEEQTPSGGPATVVFVCHHGNAKSLIASQWFNRLAVERGATVRAVARGMEPETPVPVAIAAKLSRDGFDVERYEPRGFSPADLDGASRVVLIGVERPAWVKTERATVEKWDGIPPASEGYDASRDAMRARIVALLDALDKPRERR